MVLAAVVLRAVVDVQVAAAVEVVVHVADVRKLRIFFPNTF